MGQCPPGYEADSDERSRRHTRPRPSAEPDDGHAGGHGDHHDGGTLGPIPWRMWGVSVLGVVAALIVVAAFVVATGFAFLTPAA